MLNVTMLQTPSVTLDGVPVSFPFKRADALLYYMLVRRSATRQELISLLWESCDEATGLKNLRNTLYTLKKTLGGDFLLSPQKSLVVVNSAWEVDCDYDRFTQQGISPPTEAPSLQVRRQARLLLRRVAGPHPGEAPRAVSGPAGPAGPGRPGGRRPRGGRPLGHRVSAGGPL